MYAAYCLSMPCCSRESDAATSAQRKSSSPPRSTRRDMARKRARLLSACRLGPARPQKFTSYSSNRYARVRKVHVHSPDLGGCWLLCLHRPLGEGTARANEGAQRPTDAQPCCPHRDRRIGGRATSHSPRLQRSLRKTAATQPQRLPPPLHPQSRRWTRTRPTCGPTRKKSASSSTSKADT